MGFVVGAVGVFGRQGAASHRLPLCAAGGSNPPKGSHDLEDEPRLNIKIKITSVLNTTPSPEKHFYAVSSVSRGALGTRTRLLCPAPVTCGAETHHPSNTTNVKRIKVTFAPRAESCLPVPRVALRLRSGGGGELSGAPPLRLLQLLQLRVNRIKVMKVIN